MVQLGLLLGKVNKNLGDILFSAGSIATTSVRKRFNSSVSEDNSG
jgi:hypothetical protein